MSGDFIIIGLLVLLNGFFSAAGTALANVNQHKIKQKAEAGDIRSERLLRILENPSDFYTMIQIGVSLVGLAAGAFGAEKFSYRIAVLLYDNGVDISFNTLRALVSIPVMMAISYLMMVLGDLTPKKAAYKNADTLIFIVLPLITVLSVMTKPFIRILSVSSEILVKLFRLNSDKKDDITEVEIKMMMDMGGETGNIDENEIEMINNIFEFNDISVGEIVTHRTDIIAITADAGSDAVTGILKGMKYSRIPVYEENIDNIIGVLHVKDMIKYVLTTDGMENFDLRKIMRKPFFVPMTKKTDELFRDMQKNKAHMAVVVDEYGGTFGLVTMEDLIEEIMGSILDEYDEEEIPDITLLDENTYAINGTAALEYVSEYLDISLPVDEYDTLSGFIVAQLGRIPNEDEKPEIEFNGALFKVAKVEENRIESAVVCKL